MKKLPNKIGSLRVDGQNPEWNSPQYITLPKQNVKSLGDGGRKWQPEAYEQLKDKQFAIAAAFCGSGKSILQVALGVHDVVTSGWRQKQLIVVPQSHIHRGFVGDEDLDYIPIVVGGEKYEWKINHNFCDDKSQNVLKALRSWMLESGNTLSQKYRGNIVSGLNAVTSHQALGLVWGQLTACEKKIAISNLTLRVDEAHHIKGVFDVEENELNDNEKLVMEMEATNLGGICHYIFNSGNKTSKLHLTTATPYRGDRQIILSRHALKRFSVYYLDWIEHFKTLGIEDFYLEYEEYHSDPIAQVVAKIKKEPKEKHLVVIPPTTHKWRDNGEDELQQLLSAIHKVVPKKRVLDLVTPATQDKNKAALLREPKTSGKPSQFDVVVTCMLGREGTDWCPCSRLHNTSCENSVTLAVQTLGRPFRRFDGKRYVRIYYYVPAFAVPKRGMTKRELLSDRTNALLVCMQLDEMCHPILIPLLPKAKDHCDQKHNQNTHTSLAEIFGDQYQKVKQELFEEVECLENKTPEELIAVVEDILDEYGVTDNRENIRDALLALTLRSLSNKLKSLGIDVAFIRKEGFDKIVQENNIRNASIFFGNYNKNDWTIIRSILKSNWDQMYEAYKERFGQAA